MNRQAKKITKAIKTHCLNILSPFNNSFFRKKLENQYFYEYLTSRYPQDSLINKRFYNIGAGNQRSEFDFWSYLDLQASKYDKTGIDVYYDLEAIEPLPIQPNTAEVVFSSFVIEHISVEATKNLCSEAFVALKKGGVFHSKVHCYEYGYRLLRNNLITPQVPYKCRESKALVKDFIKKHKRKVRSHINENGDYELYSMQTPVDKLTISAADAFIFHNATAAFFDIQAKEKSTQSVLSQLNHTSLASFYQDLQKCIDPAKKEPHQHNADYFSKEDMYEYIKSIGYSEVYFTQPLQSVSPALWEAKLNPMHSGFVFAIEAIK